MAKSTYCTVLPPRLERQLQVITGRPVHCPMEINSMGRHPCKGAAPNQYPLAPVIGVKGDPAATAAVVNADAVVQMLRGTAAAAGRTTAAAAAAAVGELQCFGCRCRHQPSLLAVSLRNPCAWHITSSTACHTVAVHCKAGLEGSVLCDIKYHKTAFECTCSWPVSLAVEGQKAALRTQCHR